MFLKKWVKAPASASSAHLCASSVWAWAQACAQVWGQAQAWVLAQDQSQTQALAWARAQAQDQAHALAQVQVRAQVESLGGAGQRL